MSEEKDKILEELNLLYNSDKKIYVWHKLPEDCEPVKWEQLREEDLEVHKNLFCPYYKECLSHAAGLHWKGWSCNWCKHKNRKEKEYVSKDR